MKHGGKRGRKDRKGGMRQRRRKEFPTSCGMKSGVLFGDEREMLALFDRLTCKDTLWAYSASLMLGYA